MCVCVHFFSVNFSACVCVRGGRGRRLTSPTMMNLHPERNRCGLQWVVRTGERVSCVPAVGPVTAARAPAYDAIAFTPPPKTQPHAAPPPCPPHSHRPVSTYTPPPSTVWPARRRPSDTPGRYAARCGSPGNPPQWDGMPRASSGVRSPTSASLAIMSIAARHADITAALRGGVVRCRPSVYLCVGGAT